MTATLGESPVTAFFEGDADFWGDVYGHEDAFGATIQRRHARAQAWIADLQLPASSSVLEVGCGAGFLSVALAQRGLAVTAVEQRVVLERLPMVRLLPAHQHAIVTRIDRCRTSWRRPYDDTPSG